MKDKVQKIREEVARIQAYTQSDVLKEVLDYIDKVQEEPVSEVWHDAQTEQPQAKKKILATNEYGACEVDFAINMALYWPKVIKWAYIEDLLNLSNVQRTVKNLKEPVSEDLEKIVEEIAEPTILNAYGTKELARRLRNTICCTSVSEELEKAANEIVNKAIPPLAVKYKDGTYVGRIRDCFYRKEFIDLVKTGAKWQKEHLWKHADGDDLPEIDREVIALIDNGKVVFSHRPNPEGWDAKSIITEKVEHYTPDTYGKGGWNQPNVKWWLDCSMPKIKED